MIEEFRNEQILRVRKKKRKKRLIGAGVIIIVSLTAVVICNIISNRTFEITYYDCASEKIHESVKLAVLADLHCEEYGENNIDLIRAIQEETPDLILIAGDMVTYTNPDVSVAVRLCEALTEIAPVYYCYGNHEGLMMHTDTCGEPIPLDEYIEATGAIYFRQSYYSLQVKDNLIALCGIPYGLEGYDEWGAGKVAELEQADGFRIILSHHPDLYYEKLKDVDADLAIAAHFHGGLIRIPGLGGLYHPGGGLFPKYAGGEYQLERAKLIVSRGLGGKSVVPRINNRPELVMIRLNAQ